MAGPLREGVKKPISNGLVSKRGGGPQTVSEKEKTMQNVLKRQNMQKCFVTFLQNLDIFPDICLSIFPLEPNFFFFYKNIRFRSFCIF